MKNKILLIVPLFLLTAALLCCCGAPPQDSVTPPEGGDVVISMLEADLLTGQLPSTLACFRGDHAQAPYLLVGALETDGSLTLKTQLNPEMEPSGLGSLSTELELPAFSADDLYGVVTTLSVSGPQTVSAVFPLAQLLSPSEPVNQKWTEGSNGEYMIPVAVCSDGGEYYLISLTEGSVFLPEAQLPPELKEKAIELTELGDKVSPEHCGIALFNIKAKEGPYTVCLLSFLCL